MALDPKQPCSLYTGESLAGRDLVSSCFHSLDSLTSQPSPLGEFQVRKKLGLKGKESGSHKTQGCPLFYTHTYTERSGEIHYSHTKNPNISHGEEERKKEPERGEDVKEDFRKDKSGGGHCSQTSSCLPYKNLLTIFQLSAEIDFQMLTPFHL